MRGKSEALGHVPPRRPEVPRFLDSMDGLAGESAPFERPASSPVAQR